MAPALIPDSRTISLIVALWNPDRAKQTTAASRISEQRASRYCLLTLGMALTRFKASDPIVVWHCRHGYMVKLIPVHVVSNASEVTLPIFGGAQINNQAQATFMKVFVYYHWIHSEGPWLMQLSHVG